MRRELKNLFDSTTEDFSYCLTTIAAGDLKFQPNSPCLLNAIELFVIYQAEHMLYGGNAAPPI